MQESIVEKMETLIDDVESIIRNGVVSSDTKLIAKSLLLNAHAIMQLTTIFYTQIDSLKDGLSQ